MHQNNELNDEIDLNELFLTLWRGKIYIILVTIMSVFLASYYLQSVERLYTVEYNLKPVGESENKSRLNGLGGLGGLATIAGIQLPSSKNNDFNIFKELITSREVSKIIFEDKKIIRDIFKSEWDESINNFSRPAKSKVRIFLSDTKRLLTGNIEHSYMPPNPRRLATFIDKNIQISEDKETGFLKLTGETAKPELMISLIIKAAETSDKLMRQRYIDFAIEPLTFYKQKISTARSREHRQALAALIGQEEQKLMLASLGKYFIAEPYIDPKTSLYPTTPMPMLILSFSLIGGFVIGVALILIRHRIKKEN
jgi:hypothetical protein